MSDFINDDNFQKYFFDIRKHPKPQKGQVMACWKANADFIDGWVKRHVITLLSTNTFGAESSKKILRNLVGATEQDAVRLCKEMLADLRDGASPREITAKPYRFTVEMFYWTMPEYVPDTPNWSIVKVFDLTSCPSETVEV
jgi:hypothetical protein